MNVLRKVAFVSLVASVLTLSTNEVQAQSQGSAAQDPPGGAAVGGNSQGAKPDNGRVIRIETDEQQRKKFCSKAENKDLDICKK